VGYFGYFSSVVTLDLELCNSMFLVSNHYSNDTSLGFFILVRITRCLLLNPKN
jgi:hypothetical protein